MAERESSNFIRDIIRTDLATGKWGRVQTRFPPEPNGYLHLGHAKAICVDFGLAAEFEGLCNLRLDDTNPVAEDDEFVKAIEEDVRWLGFEWGGVFHASDYFDQLYEIAESLVARGLAYVDEQSGDEIRKNRGTVTEPGTPSPYRDRSPAENLERLREMKAGKHPDGAMVLRAKIDMAADNMILRDPLMYRIRHASHHRTGDAWCIYPMYDYAHGLSDAIEGVTHSICTLEFDNNRAVYDWFVEKAGFEEPRTHQYEMARLKLQHVMLSKRRLKKLVTDGIVDGWDDPRMPTISGLRRLGVRPSAIRAFIDRTGVARADSLVARDLWDSVIRDDLNAEAPRRMAVLDPIEIEIANWDGGIEWLDAPDWPHDIPKDGSRKLPFSKTLYIEREDFAEQPPKKWKRLAPGVEVRLRYGYLVTCDQVVKDDSGRIVKLVCSYDPESKGGNAPDGRKVGGTLHWVSAEACEDIEVRLYKPLFTVDSPDAEEDWESLLDPESRVVITAKAEPALQGATGHFQLERLGYFATDPDDASIFHRVVQLKSSWGKKPAETAPAPRKKPAQKPAVAADYRPEDAAAAARFDTLVAEGISEPIAGVLAPNALLDALYVSALAAGAPAVPLANLIASELGPRDGLGQLTPEALAALVLLADSDAVNSNGAKEVLDVLIAHGGEPEAIVDARGLRQVSDTNKLGDMVDEVLGAFPDRVEAYKGGRKGLKGFFVGQVMQRSQGTANPQLVQKLLAERLD
ncbi:MAG: glutamine--tRNA ligase/YqeY domain fusion protein [Deltaproteobacteria bacterium]|nr:MAG: glutamine--tRNA ligase/YqeY domain fusion protein [Deltaproteobacteria bacterium]